MCEHINSRVENLGKHTYVQMDVSICMRTMYTHMLYIYIYIHTFIHIAARILVEMQICVDEYVHTKREASEK